MKAITKISFVFLSCILLLSNLSCSQDDFCKQDDDLVIEIQNNLDDWVHAIEDTENEQDMDNLKTSITESLKEIDSSAYVIISYDRINDDLIIVFPYGIMYPAPHPLAIHGYIYTLNGKSSANLLLTGSYTITSKIDDNIYCYQRE